MVAVGDIIPYFVMCQHEGVSLQRGMNFRVRGTRSILLMSLQPNAPYEDAVQDDGRVLIYEGHDAPKVADRPLPKSIDQPLATPVGTPTQNGLFYRAARKYQEEGVDPEIVAVYEKMRKGLWAFNGVFHLMDAWLEPSGGRQVVKFKLLVAEAQVERTEGPRDLVHSRMIPSAVKNAVWLRDGGRCVECGAGDNLHFDHILPFSKGGTSLEASNIQILCARHNLAKRDQIV